VALLVSAIAVLACFDPTRLAASATPMLTLRNKKTFIKE
jgi:hypothetical protein